MRHLNIEIKAICRHPEKVREFLQRAGAAFVGLDEQVDVYFRVPHGRLKLRQGRIENALIFYERQDQPGPKQSQVSLYPVSEGPLLREVLEKALGVWVVVQKKREIYFLKNIKFHLDQVEGLGGFVEIEVMDAEGTGDCATLQGQCEEFMQRLGVKQEDLLKHSYSDLILKRGGDVDPH